MLTSVIDTGRLTKDDIYHSIKCMRLATEGGPVYQHPAIQQIAYEAGRKVFQKLLCDNIAPDIKPLSPAQKEDIRRMLKTSDRCFHYN